MENNIFDFIKKQWLLIWVLLASVGLFTMTATAFYESTSNSMNRVVVASSAQGMMFSSNYLEEGGENAYQAKYCIELNEDDKNTSTYDTEVFIWNYNLTNISRWYPEEIKYSLKLKLTNTKGESLEADDVGNHTISLYDSEENLLTTLDNSKLSDTISNQSLPSLTSRTSENKYIIKYSGNWNLDDDTEICLQMVTELDRSDDENKYKDLNDLGQIIGLKRSSNSESKGWQAYLKEQRGNEDITKCDGFNLVVTGSGQAIITITWDTTYLDFNRNFYLKDSNLYNFSEVTYTASTNDNVWATMRIEANTASNATNHRNRYDIQLYKTGKALLTSWGFFSGQNDETTDATWVKVSVTS